MKTLNYIIAVATIIGFAFGAYLYLDKRYALAEDVKKIERRLDWKITSDQVQTIQQRIWSIEDRYEKKQLPETTKEELRDLKEQKTRMQKKLETIEKSE